MVRRVRASASHQEANQVYEPPFFQIHIDLNTVDIPSRQHQYLVERTGTTIQEIKQMLEDLGQFICRYLEKERKLDWLGIGLFHMDEDGLISFQTKTISTQYFLPVAYQKVTLEEKSASIDVDLIKDDGIELESETIVDENEIIEEEELSYGWQPWQKFALMLFLLAAMIFSIRFFMGDFNVLGPTLQKIHPKAPSATYSQY